MILLRAKKRLPSTYFVIKIVPYVELLRAAGKELGISILHLLVGITTKLLLGSSLLDST